LPLQSVAAGTNDGGVGHDLIAFWKGGVKKRGKFGSSNIKVGSQPAKMVEDRHKWVS
jgi:hypothetical protein